MTPPARLLTACLIVALALAGCIGAIPVDSADEGSATGPASSPSNGTMTADATTSSSQDIETEVPGGPFVSTRTVAIEGTLTLSSLGANLTADRGRIDVETGPTGEWSARIQVDGYGATPEEARAERDQVAVEWSIGDAGDRRLRIAAEQPEEEDEETGHANTTIEVTLPEDLAVQLEVGLESGNVTLDDLRTPFAALGVANGDLDAHLRGTRQVTIGVSSGQVNATVEPGDHGSVTASVASGRVDLRVPEGAEHGYQARASSANGEAEIRLQDGETTSSGGGPTGGSVTFVTDGYEDRSIRTEVQASASDGDVLVAPT